MSRDCVRTSRYPSPERRVFLKSRLSLVESMVEVMLTPVSLASPGISRSVAIFPVAEPLPLLGA